MGHPERHTIEIAYLGQKLLKQQNGDFDKLWESMFGSLRVRNPLLCVVLGRTHLFRVSVQESYQDFTVRIWK
jgi:hypothetical protein